MKAKVVTLSGKEWKAFMVEPWPDTWYFEEEVLTVDGIRVGDSFNSDEVADSAVMTLSEGVIVRPAKEGDPLDLVKYFLAWRKKQSMATILVEIPKENLEAFCLIVKQEGGKVL
jgi:hypothetical protein